VDQAVESIGAAETASGAARVARILVGASLFAAVIVATVREWDDVSDTVAEIGPAAILTSLGLVLSGLAASAMTWRCSLREMGASVSVPSAMKIYLVGQLGKYIPGSVWAFVVQMELARAASVQRMQSLAAGVLAVGINILVGGALGLALQPFVGDGSSFRFIAGAIGIASCGLALAPPVLGRLANLAFRVARRPELCCSPSWLGIVRAASFSAACWILYGVALCLLVIGAGGDPSIAVLVTLPAVALAMTVGALVVVSPSGIGVREAVLVAALAPVLPPTTALAVALVLRVVFTLADLLAAAATLPIRISRVSEPASSVAARA